MDCTIAGPSDKRECAVGIEQKEGAVSAIGIDSVAFVW